MHECSAVDSAFFFFLMDVSFLRYPVVMVVFEYVMGMEDNQLIKFTDDRFHQMVV